MKGSFERVLDMLLQQIVLEEAGQDLRVDTTPLFRQAQGHYELYRTLAWGSGFRLITIEGMCTVFTKSKKTALLMACIFLAPVIVIACVVGQVRYAALEPAGRNPNVVNGFAGLGPALMALAILLVSLAIAAAVIFRLDNSHFGRQGAIRWAIMGTLYGLLQQVVLTPVPSDFDFQIGSVLKQIGGDLLWKVLTLVLAYLLVFPLFGFARERLRRDKAV